MNTLKIQIKPYYQNNSFNLKDDQIHCLSTNKDEEEIQLLLKQMNLSNYTVFLQLDMENYTYGYLHTSSNKEYDLFYYNDFDDYEDEIEFGSTAWIKMIKRANKPVNNLYHFLNLSLVIQSLSYTNKMTS